MKIRDLKTGDIFIDPWTKQTIIVVWLSYYDFSGVILKGKNAGGRLLYTFSSFHLLEEIETLEISFSPLKEIDLKDIEIGMFFMHPIYNVPCMKVKPMISSFVEKQCVSIGTAYFFDPGRIYGFPVTSIKKIKILDALLSSEVEDIK